MSKILITGNKGFIGSVLFDRLIYAVGLRNLVGYDLVDGDDIRDYFKLHKVFREEGITKVIHLAALAGVRTGELFPNEYITTNIIGTQNLIRLAREFQCEQFIFFSSSSVYGSQSSPNKEDDRLIPESLYGVTKQSGEQLVKMSGLRSVIIRPFTVYGENGRKDQVIQKWINQYSEGKPISFYGDGNTQRGYTYVGDLVDGVVKVLERDDSRDLFSFQIYNLGGNEIISLKELLSIFKNHPYIKDSKLHPNFEVNELDLPVVDIKENWADITKAHNELGYNPKTKFVERVSQIISNEISVQ